MVSSGTFSPTLDKPIAMAYVRPEATTGAEELTVDIRGRLEPARVVELPFYRRSQRK
jgi:aminomethyltransferase